MMSMSPTKVFTPVRINVPLPALVKATPVLVPESTPEIVTGLLGLSTVMTRPELAPSETAPDRVVFTQFVSGPLGGR